MSAEGAAQGAFDQQWVGDAHRRSLFLIFDF
jgi:hypothetical protein